jgi:hypothetical protein
MNPSRTPARGHRSRRVVTSLAAAAAAATVPLATEAGIDNTANTDGAQLTVISTTGATALGAFNQATSGNRRILNLGVNELYIGSTGTRSTTATS